MTDQIRVVRPIWDRPRRKAQRRKGKRKYNKRYKDEHRPRWCIILRDSLIRKVGGDKDLRKQTLADDLGEWSGVRPSLSTVEKWLYGYAAPGARYYQRLAWWMDLTTDQLMDHLWPRPGGSVEGTIVTGQVSGVAFIPKPEVGEGGGGVDASPATAVDGRAPEPPAGSG